MSGTFSHRLAIDEFRRRLGPTGIGGLALAIGSLIYLAAGVAPEAWKLRSTPVTSAELARPVDPRENARRFVAELPRQGDTTTILTGIYEAAARERVALSRGEYLVTTDAESALVRYRVTMPVRGSYVQIRRFVQAARLRVPHMAIEELKLKRATIRDSQLEAQIRFAIYLRRGAA